MGFIPEEIIRAVIDRCDIAETIATYVSLKRAGKNFKALCPFHHEKTPSFMINPERQIFHCFGCQAGGNVISFVMKQERLEFPEAVRFLAERVNIQIPEREEKDSMRDLKRLIFRINELAAQYFHGLLLTDKSKNVEDARDYLRKRGVLLETVKKFQLGFALDQWDGLLNYLKHKDVSLRLIEKAGLIIAREGAEGFYDRFRHRVVFPIFDNQGRCRAFGARSLEKESTPSGEKTAAKYINSPETPVYTKGEHLYGLSMAKDEILKNDCAVIVEGYMDCLIPHQAGILNIVASLGTALTIEQIRLLGRFTKNVVLLFDSDKAGQSATLRSLDLLIEEGMQVKVALLEGEHDPDSFVRSYGAERFKEHVNNAQSIFEYKLGYLMRLNDKNTPQGKADIASQMLETIHKFNNAVLIAEYLKHLAKALGVAQEALEAEFKKLDKSQDKNDRPVAVRASTPSSPTRMVEWHILRLLLQEEELIGLTKSEVDLSDFQDGRIRAIMAKIFELFERGEKIQMGSLIGNFEDFDLQKVISQLAVEENILMGDRIKIHRDCIERIKKERKKLYRQDLVEQIKKAEIAGDQLKLEDLKHQFNLLIKVQNNN